MTVQRNNKNKDKYKILKVNKIKKLNKQIMMDM